MTRLDPRESESLLQHGAETRENTTSIEGGSSKKWDKTKEKKSSSIKITRNQPPNKPKRSYIRKKPYFNWRQEKIVTEPSTIIDSKLTPGYHTKDLSDTNKPCTSKNSQNEIIESEGPISQTDTASLNQNKRIVLLPK